MKKVGNLYDDILDIKKIQLIYDKRIRINTKNKTKLEKFEYNYVTNMKYIKELLESKTYIPGKYNIFIIREPKVRLIMSQDIIDKTINHLISEYFLKNIFDKTLIDTNIATRVNKGTHYGIKLLKKYINKLKYKEFYILKFDISKYFYNIDHDIIKDIIRTKIKDNDVINILDKIIDSTDLNYVNNTINNIKEKEINYINNNIKNKDKYINDINKLPIYRKGKGLPIGNMSSQILAIVYLNELDHFIKEKLHIKNYIRYMDDGILLHEDKEYLKYCLKEITEIIHKYKLELNNKTKIYSSNIGFEFLGFYYFIKNNKLIMKVSNKTKKRFKRKVKNMNNLVKNNKMTIKEQTQVMNSYLGHLHYGNTSKLIYKNLGIKNNYIKVEEVMIFKKDIVIIKSVILKY